MTDAPVSAIPAPAPEPERPITRSQLLEELVTAVIARETIRANIAKIQQSQQQALASFQAAETEMLSIVARLGGVPK